MVRLWAAVRRLRDAARRHLVPYLTALASEAKRWALRRVRSLGPLPAVAAGLLFTLSPGAYSGLCAAIVALISASAWAASPRGYPAAEMLAVALGAAGASAASLFDAIPDARLAIASMQAAVGALASWVASPRGYPAAEMLAVLLGAAGASAAALRDAVPDVRLAIASMQAALGTLIVLIAWRRPSSSRVRVRWVGEIRVESPK